MEAMIVFIIVGIMVTFAMPSYAKYIERIRAKRVEANLNTIYNMERRYKLDNGVYYECATVPCSAYYFCPPVASCATNLINDGLGIFMVDPYFTYSIDIVGSSGEYKVTATRNEGPCAGKTMIFTSSDRVVTRNCKLW